MATPRLTTTSYALLGLLAIRPWSAYELTGQMRRSLHYVWPKSESLLYTEPRKLVDAGLARVREEHNGARTRTVYRITAAGRRALAAWLDTQPAPPTFEIETMLRVTFADQGTPGQLSRSLRAAADWADAELRRAIPQLEGYLTDGGPFPSRLPLIAILAGFYGELFDLIRRYMTDAAELVDRWDTTDAQPFTADLRALIEQTLARVDGTPTGVAG
jgi:PadR family transcriptional regulator, regulatory protein AphA